MSRSANTLWSKFLGIVVDAEYTSLIIDAFKPSFIAIYPTKPAKRLKFVNSQRDFG
jgi:hypothetical protein